MKISRSRGWLLFTVGTLWAVAEAPASGQEALRNAVRGDRALEARQITPLRPRDDRMRLGPAYLNAGLSYSVTWNDNVDLDANNTQSDVIHHPEFNFGIFWPITQESRFSVGMGIGYEYYMDDSSRGGVTITPDSEVAWDIPYQDWVFTLYDQVSYSRDVISEGGLSGKEEYPRLENTAGIRAQWNPAEYMFELGYSHYNFFAESSDYDYQEHSAEQFFARVAYRFAPITRVGVEVSSSMTDYAEATREDNQDISIGPFIEWQLLRDLRIGLRGGYVMYTYDKAAGTTNVTSDLDTYYVGISASHRLTQDFAHSLALDRSAQQGVNQGGSVSERFKASYGATWKFHRQMRLKASPFFEHSEESQLGGSETYDRYGTTVGIDWSPKPKIRLGVSYRHVQKSSDFAPVNNDYEDNAVTFSASYQF